MRLPSFNEDGTRIVSAGGLFVVVEPITGGATWLGAAGTETDGRVGMNGRPYEVSSGVVDLRYVVLNSADETGARYLQNEIFWPMMHEMIMALPPATTENRERLTAGWRHYIEQNRAFAQPIIAHAPYKATVFVQDYQQMLVPGFLRSARSDLTIVYTHHVPWFQPQAFQLLPQAMRGAILQSLAMADAVTVHADDWGLDLMDSFRDERMVAPLIVPAMAQVDVEKLRLEAKDPEATELARHLRGKWNGRSIVAVKGRGDEPKNGMLTAARAARIMGERAMSRFNIRNKSDLERLTTDQLRQLPVFVFCAQPTRMGKSTNETVYDVFGRAFFEEIRSLQAAGFDVEIFTDPGRHRSTAASLMADIYLVPSFVDGRNITIDEGTLAGTISGLNPTGVVGSGAAASGPFSADGRGVLVVDRPGMGNGDLLSTQIAYADTFADSALRLLVEPPQQKYARWATTYQIVEQQDPRRWHQILCGAAEAGKRLKIDQSVARVKAEKFELSPETIDGLRAEQKQIALLRPPIRAVPYRPLPLASVDSGDPAAPLQPPPYATIRNPHNGLARLRKEPAQPLPNSSARQLFSAGERDGVPLLPETVDKALAAFEGPSGLFVSNMPGSPRPTEDHLFEATARRLKSDQQHGDREPSALGLDVTVPPVGHQGKRIKPSRETNGPATVEVSRDSGISPFW